MRTLTNEEIEQRFERMEMVPSTIKNNRIPVYLIEKYKHKFQHNHWSAITESQVLTEEFMDQYSSYLDWYYLPKYQVMSEAFAEKHKDKINWCYFFQFQSFSPEFALKHIEKITLYNMKDNKKINQDEFAEVYKRMDCMSENNQKKRLDTLKREERLQKERKETKDVIQISLSVAKCECCKSSFKLYEEVVTGYDGTLFCSDECLIKTYKKANQIVISI